MAAPARFRGGMSCVSAFPGLPLLRSLAAGALLAAAPFAGAQGLIEPPTAPPPRSGSSPTTLRPVGATAQERLRSYITAQLKALGAERVAEHETVPKSERWRVLKTSEMRDNGPGNPPQYVEISPPEETVRFGESSWAFGGDDWKLLSFTEAKAPGERVLCYLAETQIDGKRRLGTFLLRVDAEGRGDFTFNLQGKERPRQAFGAVVRKSEE